MSTPEQHSRNAPGTDKIVIQYGGSARRGYTDREAWTTERLQASPVSPPILFLDGTEPETVDLHTVKAFFVKSMESSNHEEPIHFHDDTPPREVLWVWVLFQNGEQMEGMMANHEGLLLHDVLTLTPTDPESNNHQVVFHRSHVREFHVLGVRSGLAAASR